MVLLVLLTFVLISVSGDFKKAVKVKAGGVMANHDVFLAPEITMANGYGAGIVKNQAFSLDHFLMVKQKNPCTYNI